MNTRSRDVIEASAAPVDGIQSMNEPDQSVYPVPDTFAAEANLSPETYREMYAASIADPEALLPKIKHAGAVFLGHHTPEALGDYVTGSNHVLPTSRAARFSSGLGLYDFLKRMSVQKAGPEGFAALAPAALRLAKAEGLPAHARSVSIRTNES